MNSRRCSDGDSMTHLGNAVVTTSKAKPIPEQSVATISTRTTNVSSVPCSLSSRQSETSTTSSNSPEELSSPSTPSHKTLTTVDTDHDQGQITIQSEGDQFNINNLMVPAHRKYPQKRESSISTVNNLKRDSLITLPSNLSVPISVIPLSFSSATLSQGTWCNSNHLTNFSPGLNANKVSPWSASHNAEDVSAASADFDERLSDVECDEETSLIKSANIRDKRYRDCCVQVDPPQTNELNSSHNPQVSCQSHQSGIPVSSQNSSCQNGSLSLLRPSNLISQMPHPSLTAQERFNSLLSWFVERK